MEGGLLINDSVFSIILMNSGVILFGVLLILFGVAMGLVFVLNTSKQVYKALLGLLGVIFCLLIGIIALDLTGAAGAYYTFSENRLLSELFSTHRWLLIQLPVLFTVMSMLLLITYREHISESHAKVYRHLVQCATLLSFASLILIALESLV